MKPELLINVHPPDPGTGRRKRVQCWVVTGLSAPCQDDENLECVSWVHGPFATSTEARAYAETMPAGFRPHILPFEPPMRPENPATSP